MLALDTPIAPSWAELVFAKTAKGREEVAKRKGGLSARQRSILIVLDGEKRADRLPGMIAAEQLEAILDELLRLELIAPTGAPVPTPVPLPAAAAPAPQATVADPRLVPIRAMMTRTADTYLGPMAAELVRQIDAAADEAQLQRALAHWHMAMQASKYGKEVAETHLALIKASLHEVYATR